MLQLTTIPVLAQQGISFYQQSSPEVIFATGTVSQLLIGETPTVSNQLVGPVFNDVGTYARYTTATPRFEEARDLAHGMLEMSTTTDETVGWEGVSDPAYDWSEEPKLIGWGEYRFQIDMAGESFVFDLSTLDGNWLNPSLGDDNKIVFYVSFIKPTEQSPVTIEVKVYNYDTQTWTAVSENQRVKFWELHGIDRQRDKILLFSQNSDYPFYINAEFATQSVEIPFYNNTHVFDINVSVYNPITVASGKKLVITDYVIPTSTGYNYLPTTWKFQRTAGILVQGGTLETYSHFSETHLTSPPRIGVNFLPLELYELSPRKSWKGIEIQSNLGGEARIRDASIRHAINGVFASQTALVSRCHIDSCEVGAMSRSGRLYAVRDTIRDCGIGVDFRDDLNALRPLPLVLIDSSQILRSATDGVQLFLLGKIGSSRRQNILIRHSEIKNNSGHGIWAKYSEALVRNCNISQNGWLRGTVFDSIPSTYIGNAGIYLEKLAGMIYLHGTDFQSNVGPGVWSTSGGIKGFGVPTTYDSYDARGWNCFHNNFESVRAEQFANIELGKKDRFTQYYKNDRNSFRYPRWKDPQSQRYINFHVISAGIVEAEHNFWLPSTDTWLLEQQANPVYSGYPIFAYDSVRCAENVSPGGPTIEIPGSEGASTLSRLMSEDSLSAAWNHIKATISDGFGESDASIYTRALQRIRLNSDIDSAQVLLEQKAFNGSDNALTLHSLMNLQSIYVILGDSTAAWHLCDTLYAKLPSDFIPDDSLAIDLYRADLLWLINKDTTSATDLITGMWTDYPEDIRVRTMYVCITQDTTAYWHGLEDGMEKSPLPERVIRPNEIEILGSHPNPFNPITTIRYYCSTAASITLRVYSTDGRLVDSRDLGLRESGVHYLQYSADHLPSGVYMAVLDNSERSASIKLVLEK